MMPPDLAKADEALSLMLDAEHPMLPAVALDMVQESLLVERPRAAALLHRAAAYRIGDQPHPDDEDEDGTLAQDESHAAELARLYPGLARDARDFQEWLDAGDLELAAKSYEVVRAWWTDIEIGAILTLSRTLTPERRRAREWQAWCKVAYRLLTLCREVQGAAGIVPRT